MDAPERIWAVCDEDISAQTCEITAANSPDGFVDEATEYVTRTHCDAMVAAAYEAALEQPFRDLTPTDASAALDRIVKDRCAELADALQEAERMLVKIGAELPSSVVQKIRTGLLVEWESVEEKARQALSKQETGQ